VSGPPSPTDNVDTSSHVHGMKLFTGKASSFSRDVLEWSNRRDSKERAWNGRDSEERRCNARDEKQRACNERDSKDRASTLPLRVPEHVRRRQLERRRAAERQIHEKGGERSDASPVKETEETYTRSTVGGSSREDVVQSSVAPGRNLPDAVGERLTEEEEGLASWPPRKMTEAEELGVCAVCLNDGADEGNVIVLCDSCGIGVHQFCYGIAVIPADGDKWLCARCTVADDSAQCVLCPMPGGALKPVRENAGPNERSRRSWSHVSCAWFMPGVTFGDAVCLAPVTGVQRIEKGRWKLTCTLCKQKNVGACIQCADPKCTTAMHVTCAQAAQLYMAMTDEGDDVQLEVYCRKHTPKERPANFSVCPELAARPQLLAQVMSGSRPLFASDQATGGKRDGTLASKHECRHHTAVYGVSSKPAVPAVSAVPTKTASPKKTASLRSHGSRAESASAARGGAVASPSKALAQAGEGGKRRATQTHTPQAIHGGGKLSQAQRDLLSTAATPVCADAVATDPFACIAPGTCAVCLTEAGNADAGALLSCDTCRVQVHEHCWGGVSDTGGVWRCDACKGSKTHHPPLAPPQCSLCPTKGGCLKKTQSGDWVHVQCALWIPELRFEEPERLDGISSTAKIPKERRLLTCQICKLPNASCDAPPPKKTKNSTSATSRPRTSSSSACVQCSKKGCFAAFHVTCAQLAGYHMVIMSGADEQDEVPPLTPFCPKHRPRFIWKSHYVDCLKFLTV
jgi:hypothetical protein